MLVNTNEAEDIAIKEEEKEGKINNSKTCGSTVNPKRDYQFGPISHASKISPKNRHNG